MKQVDPKKKIVIKSDELRLVYGEVYSPLHIDTHGEAMTAEDIRIMAHDFLASGRINKIDVQHNLQESGCVVVESFIARANDPDGFVEGAWVLGVRIVPDDLWEEVKRGELNGFSFYGTRAQIPVTAQVVVTRSISGMTEESLVDDIVPVHAHPCTILFDEDGKVLPGYTGEACGHSHPINRATATLEEAGHSHRLIIVE